LISNLNKHWPIIIDWYLCLVWYSGQADAKDAVVLPDNYEYLELTPDEEDEKGRSERLHYFLRKLGFDCPLALAVATENTCFRQVKRRFCLFYSQYFKQALNYKF